MNKLETVQTKGFFQLVQENKDKIATIVPRGTDPIQFMSILSLEVEKNPDLATCTPSSLLSGMLQCARMGLKPGQMNQAYLIPYFNGRKNCKEAQVILGYEGLRDLALRSGKIANIQSHLVYERDEFSVELGGESKLTHRPNFFGDRGNLVGVYAIAFYKDGSTQFEIVTKDELDKLAAKSKSGYIWKDHFGEMARKSAIRRLAKHLEKTCDQLSLAVELDSHVDEIETAQENETLLLDAGIAVDVPLTAPQVSKLEAMKTQAIAELQKLSDEEIAAIFKQPLANVIDKLTTENKIVQAIAMIRKHAESVLT